MDSLRTVNGAWEERVPHRLMGLQMQMIDVMINAGCLGLTCCLVEA